MGDAARQHELDILELEVLELEVLELEVVLSSAASAVQACFPWKQLRRRHVRGRG